MAKKRKRGIPKSPEEIRAMPVTGEQQGRRYSDDYIMAVAQLWASGVYPTDNALLAALGPNAPSRQTLIAWRTERRPNGLDWEELRRKFTQDKAEAMRAELGQTVAEMNAELYRVGRATLQAAIEALRPGPYYLDPECTRPIDRVYRADGTAVLLRRVWPRDANEYCKMLAEGAKQMRMARGEASERIEFFNEAQDELVMLLRRALGRLDWTEEQIDELERALEEVFGAQTLGEVWQEATEEE